MKKFTTSLETKKIFFLCLVCLFLASSCDRENKTVNLFSVEDDIQFGQEFDKQIRSSGEFNIIPENQAPQAYQRLNQYKNTLLATGKISYSDRFVWKVCIIKDDNTVNAFAVPGGYLYFYTGLIKALENEAEFVGVMAHEMAHAALRHSTKQMTKAYGLDFVLSMLVSKNQNQWVKIASDLAGGLVTLKFSRDDEYAADKHAVIYTYPTNWDARGVGDFLNKMDNHSPTPVFLSTHPSDEKRVEKVNAEWRKLGGKQGEYYEESYRQFKAFLP